MPTACWMVFVEWNRKKLRLCRNVWDSSLNMYQLSLSYNDCDSPRRTVYHLDWQRGNFTKNVFMKLELVGVELDSAVFVKVYRNFTEKAFCLNGFVPKCTWMGIHRYHDKKKTFMKIFSIYDRFLHKINLIKSNP